MSRRTAALVVAVWIVCLIAGLWIVRSSGTPHPHDNTPPPTIDVQLTGGSQVDNLWAWNRCLELGGTSLYSPDPASPVLICQGVPA